MNKRRRHISSIDTRASGNLDFLSAEKSRPLANSIERTQSMSIRLRSIISNSSIPGISSRQLSSLFKSRCKDLCISQVPDQELRFQKTCAMNIQNRRFVLSNMQLAQCSSVAIGKILADTSAFSTIDLSGNSFGDEGCVRISKSLGRNKGIVHLCLSNNNLSAEGSAQVMKTLSKHPSLTSLDLSSVDGGLRNKVCVMGAYQVGRALQLNGILTHLNLSNTLIDNEGFRYIAKGLRANTHLIYLNVANNNISNVTPFAKVLPKTSIESLNMANNAIGDTGSKFLAEAIVDNEDQNSMLSHLDLSGNSITNKGLAYLLNGVKQNGSVTDLKLDDNDFSDGLSAEFVDCLQEFCCLKSLSLANSKISDLGFLTICLGVAVNTTLKHLNIAKNNFSINERIVSAFQANSTIEKLNLSENEIKGKNMQHIADMIKKNKGLKHLNLSENGLKTSSGILLLEACHENSRIMSLNLDFSIIDPPVLNMIKDVLKKNNLNQKKQIIPRLKLNIEQLKFEPSRIEAIKCKTQRVENAKKHIEMKVNNIKIEDIKDEEEQQTSRVLTERREVKQKFYETSKSLSILMETKKIQEAKLKFQVRKFDDNIDKLDNELARKEKDRDILTVEKYRIKNKYKEKIEELQNELSQEETNLKNAQIALEELQEILDQKRQKLQNKTNKNTSMFLASARLAFIIKESPKKARR